MTLRSFRRQCVLMLLLLAVTAPSMAQGNTTLRVREFGDTRLPTVAGLDVSFRKIFRVGTRTFSPRLDIFNATNESTVLSRIGQLGPTDGRISGIQRARLMKVGLNLEF